MELVPAHDGRKQIKPARRLRILSVTWIFIRRFPLQSLFHLLPCKLERGKTASDINAPKLTCFVSGEKQIAVVVVRNVPKERRDHTLLVVGIPLELFSQLLRHGMACQHAECVEALSR